MVQGKEDGEITFTCGLADNCWCPTLPGQCPGERSRDWWSVTFVDNAVMEQHLDPQ